MKELTKDKLFTIVFTAFVIFIAVVWLYKLNVERNIPWIDKYDMYYGK